MAIEDQQNTVASHHENNGILHHFNNNSEATFQNTSISYDSEKVRQATRDIVTLFILELQFAIGEFMAKTVDSNDLEKFAMYYYHKRKQMYTAVKEETVEQNYEHLYISLIPKPSSNS
uniref:Uncharacterized protein n=1 Tax=Panagrolaimus sp. ES5 TaxID=591445 RepID=A0AC34FT44_9BILA